MGIEGDSDGPVFAAADVHYLGSGGARAAVVLAADTTFSTGLTERTAFVPEVAPYRPGEFYLRELPPLLEVLDGVRGLGLLVVDGYADLDPGGRPVWARHAHAEFGILMIGVAKSRFRTATTRCRQCADPRCARCSSLRPGCPAPTQRTWSGAWRAGTGCPTHCAAPTPSPEQARPQPR
jgi:deoxyinosine 3'endonuclease (endonuclease V)